jgi:hypothetical protein
MRIIAMMSIFLVQITTCTSWLNFMFLIIPFGLFTICKKCHDSWSCKLTLVYLITYSFALALSNAYKINYAIQSDISIHTYSFVLVLRCRLTSKLLKSVLNLVRAWRECKPAIYLCFILGFVTSLNLFFTCNRLF